MKGKDVMQDFNDRVVLITGASSGIGAQLVRAFAARGARVILGYLRREEQAAALADELCSTGAKVEIARVDVTDSASIDALIRGVQVSHGRIDVLVNNAGGFVNRALIVDADDAYIQQVFDLNARSVVALSRRVIPLMESQGGGCIINVTTQAARTGGGPGAGIYAASKAFVSTLTRTLAKELAPLNIRVNAVAPGVIDTPFHDGHSTPDILASFASAIPMKRLGTAEECVGAFLFLADNAMSGYVTGQIIEVNGGQVMP
jgi:3-oxoacyl-[acyl-carrier protein] reductase